MHNTLRKKKESESESHSVISDSLQPQNRPEYWTGEPFPSPGDLLAPNYKCVFCFKFLPGYKDFLGGSDHKDLPTMRETWVRSWLGKIP